MIRQDNAVSVLQVAKNDIDAINNTDSWAQRGNTLDRSSGRHAGGEDWQSATEMGSKTGLLATVRVEMFRMFS